MNKDIGGDFSILIDSIASMIGVQSIGKSGGKELPVSDESDIDLFIFCDEIPEPNTRQNAIDALGNAVTKADIDIGHSKYWGVVDFVYIDDVEVCIMYHTINDTQSYLNSVLKGERLDKEDNFFYPTGRCATMRSMGIFVDKEGFLASIYDLLSTYPDELAKKLVAYHMDKINNSESFQRAVMRKDQFFFHATLEEALDHYLQTLFALNKTFYPSRKRNVEYINKFTMKSPDCVERLSRVIELGGKPDTLYESYTIFKSLINELSDMATN